MDKSHLMIIDAHTHLNTAQLYQNYNIYLKNFEKIWWRILINAWANSEYNKEWITISKEALNNFPNLIIKTAVWWHPCDIPHEKSDFIPLLHDLENLYNENKEYIVAIWECWIDLHFQENPTTDVQQHALKLQAELARKLKLPLMIHSRDWFHETIEVLKDFSDLKIYFHAWWYWKQELYEAEKIFPNLWIGCTNVIEYPSASKIREAICNTKTSKIITETDAPFLPPQCFRGQQNEPSYIWFVYNELSKILGIERNELEIIVENNTKLLYWL